MDASGTGHAQPMSASPADFSAAYHTFTVEWLPDHIAYYIDGVLQGRYSGDYVLRDPACLILDLAVGGDSAGSPDGTTVFPQSFDVDYVRVWQKP
jgi:beta-glucanase (GH16 family)